MTLAELMAGKTPSESYKGKAITDNYVLAINIAETVAENPSGFLVVQEGVTEHSGTLNPTTSDSTYIRSGTQTSKTGNQRQFAINWDRIVGDPFQDRALSHDIKYGVGQEVVFDYVWFNILTGTGEKGKGSLLVEDDPSGAANENANFSATFYVDGKPAEYTYTPAA